MKKQLFFILACLGLYSNAQFTVKVNTTSDFSPKEAIMYTLNGSKDIISSKVTKKNNLWVFKFEKPYIGMMKIYFPENNNSINLISENRDVQVNLEINNNRIKDVVYLDDSNILMETMQDLQKKNEMIFPALVQIKEYYKPNSDFGLALKKEIDRLNNNMIIDETKNPFVSYYRMNYGKFLTTNSVGKKPSIEEITKFITSTGSFLETSSLLRPILVSFLNSGDNAATIKNVDQLLQTVNIETPRGQTVLSELIDIFDVYDMSMLKNKYLTEAKNLKCTINDRLAATIKSNKNVEMGAKFPNYVFNSANNTNAKSLYDVKTDKKVIVFWSSTCTHCEAELPKLLEKYNVLKQQNIEIIGFSIDADKDSYNKKIAALPWINDSELKGWNSSFVDTYNLHATPTFYILDSDNKIIYLPGNATEVLNYFKIK